MTPCENSSCVFFKREYYATNDVSGLDVLNTTPSVSFVFCEVVSREIIKHKSVFILQVLKVKNVYQKLLA